MDDVQKGQAGAEWRANWAMVMAAMVGMSFYSMITYGFSQYMQPIEQETHWSRGGIALGLGVFNIVVALLGPLVGVLVDKYGARRVALPGSVLAACGYAALGQSDSLRHWYMLWILFALFAVTVKSTVWSAAVSRSFVAGRGLALSLMLCGSAVAQALAQLITNALILRHGWRETFQWIGFGWGGLMFVLLLLFFHEAHRRPNAVTTAPIQTGLGVWQGITSPAILRIALVNFIMSTIGAGVTVHMIPLLTETGLDRTGATEITAFAGFAGIAGKLITGALLDRMEGSLVPATSFGVAAIGYALLLNWLHTPAALLVGVLVLGYTSGAGLQVTTYLVSRYGGLRNFGTIFGTLASVLYLGTSLGGWLAGAIHDRTGSYQELLLAAVPVTALMGLLMVGLGPYPTFETEK